MKRWTLICAVALCSVPPPSLRAEETITYPEALKRALAVDERLSISDASRAGIEAEMRESVGRVRPTLSLGANILTNNSTLEVQVAGPTSDPRTIQEGVQGGARLEAKWDFFDPSHSSEEAAFDQEIEASRAERGTIEATVRYETAGAYLDVLDASARLRVAEAELERARVQARLGRDHLEAGEGSTLGMRQLDLAVRALTAARDESIASEEIARERLRHLLNLPVPPRLPGAHEAGLPGRPVDLDAESILATARGARTELQAAARRAEAAKERWVAASAARRPEAGFTGAVDASTVEGFDGKKVDTRLEVGVRWSFFDSGVRVASADREAERQRQAEIELVALTRRVESEVRLAVSGFRLADIAEGRAALEREEAAAALEQTEALYGAGSATETDLAERRARLAAAEAREEAARIQRVRAFVTLRFAAGAPIPERGEVPGGGEGAAAHR